MKVDIPKDWSMKMAALEGNAEIGAGLLARDPEESLADIVREWHRVEWSRQEPHAVNEARAKQSLHPLTRAEYRLMEAAVALGPKCTRCGQVLESADQAQGCEDFHCPMQG